MTLKLGQISNTKKARKVLGRGNASGRGNYSTRGMKGQRSRSGGKSGLKLKGFKQTLLQMPKFKGMKSLHPNNQVVKLSVLQERLDDGTKINPGLLFEKNLISKLDQPVKILFDGDLKKKFEIFECLVSAKAKEAIEKAGGKILSIEKEIEEKTEKKAKIKK